MNISMGLYLPYRFIFSQLILTGSDRDDITVVPLTVTRPLAPDKTRHCIPPVIMISRFTKLFFSVILTLVRCST
jgi:hypothetical protein